MNCNDMDSVTATIRPFQVKDRPLNLAQQRVQLRLEGGLARFAKADLTQDETILELARWTGKDPDAIEELICNGCIRGLRSAVSKGCESAADLLISLGELNSAG